MPRHIVIHPIGITDHHNMTFSVRYFFQLQSMLKRNDTLPEIEQLNRHEFDLDIEEQQKLQAEADQEVERVR